MLSFRCSYFCNSFSAIFLCVNYLGICNSNVKLKKKKKVINQPKDYFQRAYIGQAVWLCELERRHRQERVTA